MTAGTLRRIIEHMSELPSDPPRLRAILAHLDRQLADNQTIGIYLRLQREAVQAALTTADRQKPPPAQRRPAPRPAQAPTDPATGYKMEPKKHPKAPQPALIHVADCTMNDRRTTPMTEHAARLALKDPIQPKITEACPFCRPDTTLGIEG